MYVTTNKISVAEESSIKRSRDTNQWRNGWDLTMPKGSIYNTSDKAFLAAECECHTEPKSVHGTDQLTTYYEKGIRNLDKIQEMRQSDYGDFLRRNYFEQIQPPMIVSNPK